MEHGSRTRLVTAIVLALVFGSGLLLGLAMDSNLVATPAAVTAERGQDEGRERRRRTPMYEQVDPTQAQRILIDSILKDHRASMRALHREFRAAYDPRYDALIQDTRRAITGVFTPDQAAQYELLIEEFDRAREERNRKQDRD